jgi:phospho-N-acetylmuramoyl-pentapeptide-transferase
MNYLIMFMVALIGSLVVIPWLIPFLRQLKFGQSIRSDGPSSHLIKQGTPVMGGIVFILVPVLLFLLVGYDYLGFWETHVMLGAYLGYGLIGFWDDYLVVVRKNSDGLRPRYKFALQSLLAVVLIAYAMPNIIPVVHIPFTHIQVNIGFLYPLIAFVMFTATSNGTNLSDGLDGLCAGLSIIAFVSFTIVAFWLKYFEVALFLVGVIGALLGYLYYNKAPAKIFMGDVGSLALGGLLAAVGLVMHQEFMILIFGFVFVVEVLSVVLQVGSYKLRNGKRIFKMAPIHHHFELSGMDEQEVVRMFWAVGFLMMIIGLLWGGIL